MNMFGVELNSRRGRWHEEGEMILFMLVLESRTHIPYTRLKEIFYDSNSDTAFFSFHGEPDNWDGFLLGIMPPPIPQIIETCAKETLSQFELNGCIGHGNSLAMDK